eukprot:TRINITY_DN21206_c0_g1_i1.p1 TRINITY_DN21206_c0_g1~~TRINITY_DN21206_c0_g1_i1.p1  ORF type:complete len:245 (-),score=117.36 TRINITY_DN21206_c0_g1_i1:617-1351(-)
MADIHEDDRKLFVGALPQEAKEDDIKEYFGQFGEIDNINLKIDQMTGRSRGFAFIVFKEVSALDAAMANNAHVVKGKKVTCKKAEAKQGKIFVGKLPVGDALSKEDIQAHFSQYGEVVEVTRPIDKNKNNEAKSFGFVTFAREQVAKDLVKQGETTIGEHTVEIKKVTPKDPSGGFGGGAGGMGGWGFDPYGGYGGFGGYGDFGYGGYGGGPGGWGGFGGGPAGGKMRGAGGRGRGGRGRGRPY